MKVRNDSNHGSDLNREQQIAVSWSTTQVPGPAQAVDSAFVTTLLLGLRFSLKLLCKMGIIKANLMLRVKSPTPILGEGGTHQGSSSGYPVCFLVSKSNCLSYSFSLFLF